MTPHHTYVPIGPGQRGQRDAGKELERPGADAGVDGAQRPFRECDLQFEALPPRALDAKDAAELATGAGVQAEEAVRPDDQGENADAHLERGPRGQGWQVHPSARLRQEVHEGGRDANTDLRSGSKARSRDAIEWNGPRRRPQKRLGRRLEGVAKAVGGGYCRSQMPLKLALAIRETVAGHRLGVLEGGGGVNQCIRGAEYRQNRHYDNCPLAWELMR